MNQTSLRVGIQHYNQCPWYCRQYKFCLTTWISCNSNYSSMSILTHDGYSCCLRQPCDHSMNSGINIKHFRSIEVTSHERHCVNHHGHFDCLFGLTTKKTTTLRIHLTMRRKSTGDRRIPPYSNVPWLFASRCHKQQWQNGVTTRIIVSQAFPGDVW